MNPTFTAYFTHLSDPRIECCKKSSLLDIVFLSIAAVISGSSGREDIEAFGQSKLELLRQFRHFESGIPLHDTIARVMCRLKADEIDRFFNHG